MPFITPSCPNVVLQETCPQPLHGVCWDAASEMRRSREEARGCIGTEGHSLHTEVISSHPAVINVQNDLVVINGCADNLEKSRA